MISQKLSALTYIADINGLGLMISTYRNRNMWTPKIERQSQSKTPALTVIDIQKDLTTVKLSFVQNS